VEGDPDVGVPVDRERLPGLVLQWPRERAGPGHQDDGLRLIAVEEDAGRGGIGGIGDLRPDGAGAGPVSGAGPAGAGGQLGQGRRGAGHGDHLRAGLGEGGGDPAAQAAARPDDNRGPAG
jgi:hypothetical protein